jgi:DNA polymerase-1
MPDDPDSGEATAGRSLRARGRFTRNFVVQASAADWAIVLLAGLRRRLAGTAARLVFFQHDEVIVHCPEGLADTVADAVSSAAADAGELVFGPTPVRFPVTTAVVASYADAK